jgi:hypothetical protein
MAPRSDEEVQEEKIGTVMHRCIGHDLADRTQSARRRASNFHR